MPPKRTIAWKPFIASTDTASARLMAYYPCSSLQKMGIPCEMFVPARQSLYDLVVFQKAYTDTDILYAQWLKANGKKVVFDLCDNLQAYLGIDPDNPMLLDQLARLDEMFHLANVVTVSTPELCTVIPEGIPVRVIDDAMEDAIIGQARQPVFQLLTRLRPKKGEALRLVWFGNIGSEQPPSGLFDLTTVQSALETVHQKMPISLTVISNSQTAFKKQIKPFGVPTRYMDWNLKRFAWAFCGHDICILPVSHNAFTRCKTQNRLVLSLMLGVPVVADAIPSYESFAEVALLGNWEESLLRYGNDPELRRRHVAAGQQMITAQQGNYARQWQQLINELLP